MRHTRRMVCGGMDYQDAVYQFKSLPRGGGKDKMKNAAYKSYDGLPLMLSVPNVAAVLGISRAGAYDLVKSAGFPSLTIGSRILVPKDKLFAWTDEKSSRKTSV